MSYIYRLAGENLEMAEAELRGFLKSQKISEKPERDGRVAETDSEPRQLKRLALIHEAVKKKAEIKIGELKEFKPEEKPENSFSIICKKLGGDLEPPEIEKLLGERYSSETNSVDLEKPETEIYAYATEDQIIIGELVQDIDRGLYQKRSNEKRPFSSPVSLDPVLARVLVNLSVTEPGEKVLDPFCGTGGMLIEAGLCGIQPLGTDSKKEMVEGTRKNLEEYGIISHDIREMDAEESLEVFEPDTVITDLPYGKASKVEGEIEEKVQNLIEEFDGRVVFMYDKPSFGGIEADFEVYVHKSLTRYVFYS